MKKIQFRCELLSDIVLNDSPATEGKRRCLDFIPGNNFLGIAAAQLYKESYKEAWTIFHSGQVRFGDAHPSINGIRGLHVPASLFYPKLSSIKEENYIHHFLKQNAAIRTLQLKQARVGFYVFDKEHTATKVAVSKDFSIKSAYDSDKRRAKDENLFGYEALCEGLVTYFTVEIDDEAVEFGQDIVKALSGHHHVGRSRSAQYGRVNISEEAFEEAESTDSLITIQGKTYIAVYADSRLIFFDEKGNSTFRPQPIDLGITDKDAEIDWTLSQIRTFQYAPWNYKRQAFDADRCGIEKGSVFLVKTSGAVPTVETVGSYRNEGFGRVIYNPVFLQADESGHSVFKFQKQENRYKKVEHVAVNTPLIEYLKQQQKKYTNRNETIKRVNTFVERNAEQFNKEQFASQWGSIRNLAMVYADEEKLKQNIESYLTHGVAADKWAEQQRKMHLDKFLKENKGNLQEAVINLASEMAKICKSKENEK
ncbi:hypothetical protein [Prevotella falsenii]|uniref:hypothetical protein n=1 Tax=Prevotella falsenii TaxID=515414 RepID=UPI000469BDCD|nr:hypothetical protein [Prevotella falsenii]